MTVPGVGLVTATAFLAQVGDVTRFPNPNRLVSYLGLDPQVRQSGESDAHTGRISKEGSALVRHVLVEAAQTAIRSPGPLRAFFERVRARRGHAVAIVAVARKLVVLFWHMLASGQDYAYSMPTPTAKKLRERRAQGGRAVPPRRRLAARPQPRGTTKARAPLSRTRRGRLPPKRRRLATPTSKKVARPVT